MGDGGAALAQLIRARREAILDRWEQAARTKTVAAALPRDVVRESMPELLERLAAAADRAGDPDPAGTVRAARAHADQRMRLGYDAAQLAAEYVEVRKAIVAELGGAWDGIPAAARDEIGVVIDELIVAAMERFSYARRRKVDALERISSEALGERDLEGLFVRLLDVLTDVAPEVDLVTILAREGDMLHVRLTRGLEEEVRREFAIAIGEGFAGTIAATRRPLLLHDAANDPLVKSEVIREVGVRALYGVPLVGCDEVLGVAHMGSLRAYDFHADDLLFFRAVANRAAALMAGRREADAMRDNERFREQFLGVLGHDMRAPLQAIVGSAQLLLRHGPQDERARRGLDRIARSAERMARLVTDVLDFARARLGAGIPLSLGWVDLEDLCRSAVEEAEAAQPGRVIRLSASASASGRICCDHDRIAQVVSNLLANAIQHGAPDAPIDLTLSDENGGAVLTVHNEGPPIPADLLPCLFEPFRRGASGKGLGLGLYIVHAIVAAHGGGLEVRSREGAGTTVVVKLPREGRRAHAAADPGARRLAPR